MSAIDPAALRGARVLVAGDVMLDRYWHGEVERISPEAPVPVVRMTAEELRLGGAANVARNVAALGAGCTLAGIIGRDEGGARVTELLAQAGVADALVHDAAAPTTVKLRINGRAQQLLRVDCESEPSAAALDDLHDALAAEVAGCGVLVLSDYAKGGLARVSELIAMGKGAGRTVLVDPKGRDFTIYRGADLLTPNQAELIAVIGRWADEAELEQRVRQLMAELEIGALLLTRSERGLTLFDAGGRHDERSTVREVYDVTGAGDTVIAVMAVLLAAGCPLRVAAGLANRAGGIVVGRFGAATVSAEELLAG